MRHSDQMERGSNLPAGTLTFLFSDIERSTRHLQEFGPAWSGALEDHHRLMREAIAEHAGTEVDTAGDSFLAVFATAPDAVRAALAAQRRLGAHPWPGGSVRWEQVATTRHHRSRRSVDDAQICVNL
jgi:class 3 adenylate cyclase